jgi:two-component system CheB/CheR fusion protein
METLRAGMAGDELDRVIVEVFRRCADYAVILLDPQLRIVSWNAGAENLFGHAEAAVTGLPGDLIFTPEDRQRHMPEHEAAMARSSGRAHDDRWHVRKDGTRFWASGVLLTLNDEQGRAAGFAKVVRDRTDLRMQIETLKNRLAAVLEQRQRQSVALGTLAHELRNPLAPLSNAAQLIRHAGRDDARLDYPLQIIDRQIAFLQRLIDDMLDVTRIGAGKLRLQTARFVLQAALEHALDTVSADADARRQALQAVLPETPIEIEADRDRLVQVVVNLLNNAVRYTPPGGAIYLKATVEAGHAVVRVEDTGQGIPKEIQPRVFELFTQGTAGAGRSSGLGIGLALVKELVAAHGGTVSVRSEGVGRGSEFTVRLPLQPLPAAPA